MYDSNINTNTTMTHHLIKYANKLIKAIKSSLKLQCLFRPNYQKISLNTKR